MKAIARDNYIIESHDGRNTFQYTKGKVYTFSITSMGVLMNDDNKLPNLMCKEEVNNKFDILK